MPFRTMPVEEFVFVSTRTAAKQVNLSHDYIARLAREGKIRAQQSGRSWLVDVVSLLCWMEVNRLEKECKATLLRQERAAEKLCSEMVRTQGWVRQVQRGAAMQALVYVCVAVGFVSVVLQNVNVTPESAWSWQWQSVVQMAAIHFGTESDAERSKGIDTTVSNLHVLATAEEERLQTEYMQSWFAEPVLVVWNTDTFTDGVLVRETAELSYMTPFVLRHEVPPRRE